jgi:hypothetical protein
MITEGKIAELLRTVKSIPRRKEIKPLYVRLVLKLSGVTEKIGIP